MGRKKILVTIGVGLIAYGLLMVVPYLMYLLINLGDYYTGLVAFGIVMAALNLVALVTGVVLSFVALAKRRRSPVSGRNSPFIVLGSGLLYIGLLEAAGILLYFANGFALLVDGVMLLAGIVIMIVGLAIRPGRNSPPQPASALASIGLWLVAIQMIVLVQLVAALLLDFEDLFIDFEYFLFAMAFGRLDLGSVALATAALIALTGLALLITGLARQGAQGTVSSMGVAKGPALSFAAPGGFCSNCGIGITPGAAFCGSCGAPAG